MATNPFFFIAGKYKYLQHPQDSWYCRLSNSLNERTYNTVGFHGPDVRILFEEGRAFFPPHFSPAKSSRQASRPANSAGFSNPSGAASLFLGKPEVLAPSEGNLSTLVMLRANYARGTQRQRGGAGISGFFSVQTVETACMIQNTTTRGIVCCAHNPEGQIGVCV